MLKNNKLYTLVNIFLTGATFVSPFVALAGLGTSLYYVSERNELVENLQQEAEVVKNLRAYKQQILNDYEKGLISDKELSLKMQELNMPDAIINVAKLSNLSQTSQENIKDVENLEKTAIAVSSVAVGISVLGIATLSAKKSQKYGDIVEFEEDEEENLFIG